MERQAEQAAISREIAGKSGVGVSGERSIGFGDILLWVAADR